MTSQRMERIEWLLQELRHEITRGMMEREIDEHIGYVFIVPTSARYPGGVVRCEFRTDPMSNGAAAGSEYKPRLSVVKQ